MPTLCRFIGIRILELRCVVVGIRGRKNTVVSELSIFWCKNHDYKMFFCVALNPCVPIFRVLDVYGNRKTTGL